jgi:hypothetical protein
VAGLGTARSNRRTPADRTRGAFSSVRMKCFQAATIGIMRVHTRSQYLRTVMLA